VTCCRRGRDFAADRECIAVDEPRLVQFCPRVKVAEALVSDGQRYRSSSVLRRQADRNEIRSLVSSESRRSELLLRRSVGGAVGAWASAWAKSLSGSASGEAIAAKVLLYSIMLAASVSSCDLYERRRCAAVSSTVGRCEIARCARFLSI
jgi:hypothetical protein